jgi:hypothetical protein
MRTRARTPTRHKHGSANIARVAEDRLDAARS